MLTLSGLGATLVASSMLYGGPAQEPPLQLKQAFVAGVNDFGIGLTQQLASKIKSGNLVVSPVSAALAHILLLHGSIGQGQTELKNALGQATLDDPTILSLAGLFQARLCGVSGSPFTLADALVGVGSASPTSAYLSDIRRTLNAEFFTTAPGDVGPINKWAAQHTKNRIPKILEELSGNTKFVLLNAATYDGHWVTGFTPSETRDGSFAKADGKRIQVKTMARGEVPTYYMQRPDMEAVIMPYVDGAYSMLVALPQDKGTPAALMASWMKDGWAKALKELKPVPLEVRMPKFTMRSRHNLNPALQALGVKSMFTEIDVSPMLGSSGGGGIRIEQDIQEAYIEVDENGTKAAAVTAISGGALGGGDTAPREPKRFIVDRPFVFAIIHNTSGAILFLGVCSDPSDGKQ